jgi:hypothetical protein
MLPHGGQGLVALGPKRWGIQPTGGTEGREEFGCLLGGPIAAGAHLKHLHQAKGEERISLKAPLLAQQVKFNQKLINQPPIQRADHMGKGSMESSLAVGNSEKGAHAAHMIRRLRP